MTTPEPTPADPHLNHDSSTDHPTYANTQRDTIMKKPRTRETMEATRPPASSYETGVTKDRGGKILVPRAKVVKTVADASAGLPSAEHKVIDGPGALTSESLAEFLTRDELDRLQLDPSVLPHLWHARREPPITKATLSELDLDRFSTDPQLRHDVYMDRGVSFRPVENGPLAKKKSQEASRYWDALVIEFALHITRRKLAMPRSRCARPLMSPWVRLTNPGWEPRLRTMFKVIKEITKTLVPQLEWTLVDARLDVDLIIQELEQGVCDVNGLIGWLGTLLLGSCSPMRDPDVKKIVSTIQEGVNTANARVIVNGLKDLFGILETMKLDVANHQLRILRLLMVEDCVRFQQKVFMHRMTLEPDLKEARSWFRTAPDWECENEFSQFHRLSLVERRNAIVRSDLAVFMYAVVDLVVAKRKNFPPTFEYDVQRLYRLQAEFQDCLRMATYVGIFNQAVYHLGFTISATREVRDNLTRQITDLTAHLDAPVGSTAYDEAVTLQIVRQAYLYCGNDSLPSDPFLKEIEETVRRARDPRNIEYRQAQAIMFNELYDLVEDYVISTINLNPWAVIDRLNPMPSDPYAPNEDVDLPVVARRLAHILVLHWRVWAPILYQQPQGRVPDQTPGEHSWLGTGGGSSGDGFGDGDDGFGGGGGGNGRGETLSFGSEGRSMDIGTNCDGQGVI